MSMPGVGLEPTIPAFERAKTVHVLRCPYTYESDLRVRLGSARVQMSRNRLCGPQSWEFAHACVVKYIPRQARRAGLVRVWAPLDRTATVIGLRMSTFLKISVGVVVLGTKWSIDQYRLPLDWNDCWYGKTSCSWWLNAFIRFVLTESEYKFYFSEFLHVEFIRIIVMWTENAYVSATVRKYSYR
jgi:hypothetical protein